MHWFVYACEDNIGGDESEADANMLDVFEFAVDSLLTSEIT